MNDSGLSLTHVKGFVDREMQQLKKKSFVMVGRAKLEFFDQDGDNAIKNLVTVRLLFTAYKAPRIVTRNINKPRR